MKRIEVNGQASYIGKWEDHKIVLTEKEYKITMGHVESMRHLAEENNYYEHQDEGETEYLDPDGWKLSDTLNLAHSEGEGKNTSECIKKGLKILSEESDCTEPCGDDDADDIN